MGRPKKGATKKVTAKEGKQPQAQPSRNALVSKLRTKFSRELHKLESTRDEQLNSTRSEIMKAFETNKNVLENKFNKDMEEINKKFPVPDTYIGKVRAALPNIYEMLYVGEQGDKFAHMNPWMTEVCDDQDCLKSERCMEELQSEFNSVLEPMFQLLSYGENFGCPVVLGRHMSNRPHGNGCGYSEDMLDPCKEPVDCDYYLEFTISSIEDMRYLLAIMDTTYVYHNTDQAKKKGYMWYVVFKYPGMTSKVVLRLYWRPYFDPMYILGGFLQVVRDNTNLISTVTWGNFLQRYQNEIQYIGKNGFRSYNSYRSWCNYENDLHKKYWKVLYREPRKVPLQMEIKPEY